MSSRFTPNSVKSAGHQPQEPTIVPIDAEVHREVKEFEFPKLKEPGGDAYRRVKERFGALAATDPDRQPRTRRDGRFSVNPVLRESLLIDEEERRVIEERVQVRVGEISQEAGERGYREGFAEGERLGREKAEAVFRAEAQVQMERLMALVDSFEEAKDRIFKENERVILETVAALTKKTVIRELQTDREYLSRLASQIVERTGARDQIRIRVSPADEALIAQLRSDLTARFGKLQNLTIEAHPAVQGGGCEVECDWSLIDASLATQLDSIHESLVKDHRQ